MTQTVMTVSAVVLLAVGSLFGQSQLVSTLNGEAPNAGDSAGVPPSVGSLPPAISQQREVEQNVRDIHFDFDRSDLRSEERSTVESDAQWLKAHPDVMGTIEGDADERGEIVYNVALSDKRAATTKDALVSLGVPADQIVYATGWAKRYPICTEADESC